MVKNTFNNFCSTMYQKRKLLYYYSNYCYLAEE